MRVLTATPRNKSAWDIYHQIKLFHQTDITNLPIDPPDLKQYLQMVEKGDRNLPDLLSHILIRRTRNHILRFYGLDSENNFSIATISNLVIQILGCVCILGENNLFFTENIGFC